MIEMFPAMLVIRLRGIVVDQLNIAIVLNQFLDHRLSHSAKFVDSLAVSKLHAAAMCSVC